MQHIGVGRSRQLLPAICTTISGARLPAALTRGLTGQAVLRGENPVAFTDRSGQHRDIYWRFFQDCTSLMLSASYWRIFGDGETAMSGPIEGARDGQAR